MSGFRTEQRGSILEVVLDRPPANAIDPETSRALGSAFVKFRDDATLRVGIVTCSVERFFSAGWNIKAATATRSTEIGEPAALLGSRSFSTSASR
jgi:enoyl-CoA hydratase/carnithine racemase